MKIYSFIYCVSVTESHGLLLFLLDDFDRMCISSLYILHVSSFLSLSGFPISFTIYIRYDTLKNLRKLEIRIKASKNTTSYLNGQLDG